MTMISGRNEQFTRFSIAVTSTAERDAAAAMPLAVGSDAMRC
jgi:hypothetical protein